MNDFNWSCPTSYYFGRDAVSCIHKWDVLSYSKKVLIVWGGGSAESSGLMSKVRHELFIAGVAIEELSGVRSNPEIHLVRKGVTIARETGLDAIIAVGGGSVIDCAKAISFAVFYKGDPWDFFERKTLIEQALPLACVLTIPAAGSESSSSCVINNDELGLKRGLSSEIFRPKAAYMDPSYTFSLPPYQTAAGATDMIAHICERWFSRAGNVVVTDGIAASLIRTIMDSAVVCLEIPDSYEARANLMWAGTLAHNGLTGLGRNANPDSRAGGWESHALEHELSALKPEITHGAGLAVMLPAWMSYVWRENPTRFLEFGRQVFGLELCTENEEEIEAMVLNTIALLKDFFRRIGMPTSLYDFNLSPSDIPTLLEHLEQNKGAEFGELKRLNLQDAKNIYLSAFV